jgi:Alr-MurF fusion protein
MIYLDDLRNATGAQLFGQTSATEFTGFCVDPARTTKGSLFIAPDSVDSNTQVVQAIAAGAAGVFCQQPPTSDVSGVTVILVGDTAVALGQWTAYVLRQYHTAVVAVMGNVGSRMASASIAAVLGTRYSTYYLTTAAAGLEDLALCLGGLTAEHQIAVVELIHERTGDTVDLVAILQPSVFVITSLQPSIAVSPQVKQRLTEEVRKSVDSLPEQATLVVNNDDHLIRDLISSINSPIVTYSTNPDTRAGVDLVATGLHWFVDKTGFDLTQGTTRARGLWSPAVGKPGISATLSALATGLLLEVPLVDGLESLKQMQPLAGFMTPLEGLNQTFLIDDSADASPSSTLASISLLQSLDIQPGRRILVLGDLTITTESAERAYQELGSQAASVTDYFITIGDLPALAAGAASAAGMLRERIFAVYRYEDAFRIVEALLQPGDVILVSGGRSSRMNLVTSRLLADPGAAPVFTESASITDTPLRTGTSWVELDLHALAQNLSHIKERAGKGVEVLAVVKANAYGHGGTKIAATAVYNGASMLGTSSIAEALDLRAAGIDAPILILGTAHANQLQLAVENNLTVTLYDKTSAQLLSQAARDIERNARYHLRVDTGLGDYGLMPQEVAPFVRDLIRLEWLTIDGIYTDFAAADTLFEAALTHQQLEKFQSVLKGLQASGLSIPRIHAANSAAIFTVPNSSFTMVRAGISLYGLHPSIDVSCPPSFRPVLSWKTQVAQTKLVPAGWPVGYGRTYQTDRETRIAMIPVGYADGFRSSPRNWGEVLISGKRARLIGRVGMDRSALDITHLPDVVEGDEVVLIGSQGRDTITAEDVARRLDCTNYEVVASISARIPRVATME